MLMMIMHTPIYALVYMNDGALNFTTHVESAQYVNNNRAYDIYVCVCVSYVPAVGRWSEPASLQRIHAWHSISYNIVMDAAYCEHSTEAKERITNQNLMLLFIIQHSVKCDDENRISIGCWMFECKVDGTISLFDDQNNLFNIVSN